jgi:hypothetical protein
MKTKTYATILAFVIDRTTGKTTINAVINFIIRQDMAAFPLFIMYPTVASSILSNPERALRKT